MANAIFSATSDRFFDELEAYGRQEFSGRLSLGVGKACWRVYLTLGRLAWVDGGIHPWRRWHRQIDRLKTPEVRTAAARLESTHASGSESPAYAILVELLERKKIEPQEIIAILKAAVRECLFDAIWVLEGQTEYVLTADANVRPSSASPVPRTLLPTTGELRELLQQEWAGWCGRGLKDCRPSWAPEIAQPEPLRLKTNPATYQMLETLLDGKRTLQDLAVAMQRDLESLTAMLQPYARRGWIEWKEVGDAAAGVSPAAAGAAVEGVADLRAGAVKTIAAVDDSPQALKLLEGVAAKNNHTFIGIADGLSALTILPERRPDVIFVDAVMPVMNGYELCQKIRRISSLRDTPIVLLSGNLIDQVRAVLAGADECITKPATPEQLAQAMRRHAYKEAAPAAKVKAAPQAKPNEKLPAVACVDDCNLTQNIIKTVVTGQGYRFLGIAGSLEAIASLVEFQPDLILLDLVMPTMDGYELCERLREYDALKETPIVIFSGNPIDRARATAAGVTAYFNKPLTPSKMNQVLAYLDR